MKKGLYFVLAALYFCSCSSPTDSGGTGTIHGFVTDKATGEPVPTASVQLRPSGKTILTGSDGRYEFTNVEAGNYSLVVTKTDYSELIDDFQITVKPNAAIPRNVQIEKLPSALRLIASDGTINDITGLYFGSADVSRTFSIFNNGADAFDWRIENYNEWISVSPLNGTLGPGEQQSVTVVIDRSNMEDDVYGGNISVITQNSGTRDLAISTSDNFQPSSSSNVTQSGSSSSSGEISPIDIAITPEGTVLRGANLSAKLAWLNRNAESHKTYIVEVDANDNISVYTFQYSGAINVTVILRGDDANRSIRLSSNGKMFNVNSNVTLVLDNNITLQGHSQNTGCMVYVNGGTLRMNEGATITGNSDYGVQVYSGTFEMRGGTISGNTSGVYIYNSNGSFAMNGGIISGNAARGVDMRNGTFAMDGGTISGNAGGVYVNYGTFTMDDGTISGNAASSGGGVYMDGGAFNMRGGAITGNTAREYGGGVYRKSGTFAKSGGTITGYNSDQSNGNKVSDNAGILPRRGHAVYASADVRKETTTGPTENLSAPSYGNATGIWDE